MRYFVIFLLVLFSPDIASAKLFRDTVYTHRNDQIIVTYEVTVYGKDISLRFDKNPRIIPGEDLRKDCKGDLSLLKVVIFDRVGDFGKVKWKGMSPTAFMVPSGLSFEKSGEGFYILGESSPMSFVNKTGEKKEISLPLYVAVYEKKQTYRIVGSCSAPLRISVGKAANTSSGTLVAGTETERIAVHTDEEQEEDNEDITKALSSISMIRQLLPSETELPFSQTLQQEIYNLRSLKDRVKDSDVISRINDVLIDCNDKERELKEEQKAASLAAQAQEQALMAQQKAEDEARQKEAEEKARLQEEKQQKRTVWMIVGGVILAILGFIGNGIFKHFRDVRNRKSIMEMQESLAKQAAHEAGRRSREIVRNKAHQAVNKGKSKIRESIENTGKTKKNTKIKSI